MYYYIFDPPQGTQEYQRTAQIKEQLSVLGIAGEMTMPQPGRSVEDLVNLAISKRYSTVVAVGGMDLVNKVAMALEPYDVVFGIIPSSEHPDVARLIGTGDWKNAAEQLKRRRWQTVRLGLLNSQTCFLTPATLTIPSEVGYRIDTADFSLTGAGGIMTLTPARTLEETGLEITIEPLPERPSLLAKIFKKEDPAVQASRMVVESAEIATSTPLEAIVAGTPLAVTPLSCTTQEKAVRLIVARGSGTS